MEFKWKQRKYIFIIAIVILVDYKYCKDMERCANLHLSFISFYIKLSARLHNCSFNLISCWKFLIFLAFLCLEPTWQLKSPLISFSWITLNTVHKSFDLSSLRVGLRSSFISTVIRVISSSLNLVANALVANSNAFSSIYFFTYFY